MKKIDIFFTKSDTFWSKAIYWFYKIFFKKETTYTHCGLLFDNKIFEIDAKKKSGFYDRIISNYYKINCGYIDELKYNYIINKYSDLGYDTDEILLLLTGSNKIDIDNEYICSTLVSCILKDINILKEYNNETINPDELFVLLKEEN